MKQHFVVLQWTQKRCFHSDNAQVYCVTQNTLKYFDIPKITVVFLSLRSSLYRACRNTLHSVWLCRKEDREMLEDILSLRVGSHKRNSHWYLMGRNGFTGLFPWSCSIHLNISQWPTPIPPHAITLPLGSFSRGRRAEAQAGDGLSPRLN